jgi:hypothetical protein
VEAQQHRIENQPSRRDKAANGGSTYISFLPLLNPSLVPVNPLPITLATFTKHLERLIVSIHRLAPHETPLVNCATTTTMASTGVEVPGSAMAEYITADQTKEYDNYEKREHEEAKIQYGDSDVASIKATYDSTHRQLRPRHIQLIGIGGTIGTALYVQIGRGLLNGGPGSLFLAFTLWYVMTLGDWLDQPNIR